MRRQDECARMIETEQAQRKNDEYQVFHLPTFSFISRKYEIYDLPNVVGWIKANIFCINQPIVLCHLTDPLRRLLPSQRAYKMVGDGLQYQEYLVKEISESCDLESRMAALRYWNIRMEVNESDSEIHLEIDKPIDSSKWIQYTSVSLDFSDAQSAPVTDTVHMLVMDNATGTVIKKAFVDFKKFVYCGKLFKTLNGMSGGGYDERHWVFKWIATLKFLPTFYDSKRKKPSDDKPIIATSSGTGDCHNCLHWLNKWMTTRKELLTFYSSNITKLSNTNPINAEHTENKVCRVSVVGKAVKQIHFIPIIYESQWSKETVTNLVSQEYIMIRCITDDDVAWVISCSDCATVADVKSRLRPLVVKDHKNGNLMLIGSNGQLSGDTQIDRLDPVIHYAVVLKYENVTKLGNIGRGAYGLVSRCKIGKDEMIYAMKEIEKYDHDSEDKIKISINEVMVATRVGSHPNVVKYRRFFENNLSFYIVMDFMKESLHNYIQHRKGVLKEAEIISFARQTLEGLKHLHDQKVIHRDIRCKNVLIDENGCVKLCDFGLSKCQNVNSSVAGSAGGCSQVGPHRIMAPEVLDTKGQPQYGQKSDIWQFGLMLVEMITGMEHYPGRTDPYAAYRLTKDKRVEYEMPSQYSPKLKDFVDKCLTYDPACRPTCVELLQNDIFQPFQENEKSNRTIANGN